MKQFTFTQHLNATREITVLIKDEAKFKELCQEHIEDGDTINYWDLDEMDDEVVELHYGEVDWDEEEYDDFYFEMNQQGYPFV